MAELEDVVVVVVVGEGRLRNRFLIKFVEVSSPRKKRNKVQDGRIGEEEKVVVPREVGEGRGRTRKTTRWRVDWIFGPIKRNRATNCFLVIGFVLVLGKRGDLSISVCSVFFWS